MRRLITRPSTHTLLLAPLLALLLIAIIASPIALSFIASRPNDSGPFTGTDWILASAAGQAYGGISAILAGIALLAVAVSLIFQARQVRIAQLQAVHEMQMELFALAYDHPELTTAWAGGVAVEGHAWKLRTYLNLIFRYLSMSYEMDNISDAALNRSVSNRFKVNLGREYWESSRSAWATGSKTTRRRQFYKIVEDAYQESLKTHPLAITPAPLPQPSVSNSGSDISVAARDFPDGRRAVILSLGVCSGIIAGNAISSVIIERKNRKGMRR